MIRYYLYWFILNLLVMIPMKAMAAEAYVEESFELLTGPAWRVGIFSFLVFGMIVYVTAIVFYIKKSKTSMKKGERIMFGCMFFGVLAAIIFSTLQLLEGFLF